MDPISITGLALAAFQALSKTYDFVSTFVKSSRETDQSVATLQEHIFGLCQVLNAVSTVIVHPALEDPLSYNADLQNLIGTSVKDCGSIADDLSAKLNELKLPSKRAYNQVWNQIKLRIRQDDIDSLLSRIKTHSINLQLAIGTINVLISANLPDTIANRMADHFARLEKMVNVIGHRLDASGDTVVASGDESLSEIKLDKNTKALMEVASSIMSGSSVSGDMSTSEQGVPLRSAFDYIGGNLSVINEESGARPEPGRFLRVAQKSQVDNWLQTSIVALGINGGGLTNVPPSLPSPPLSAGIPSMQAAQEVSEIIYGPSDEDNLFDLHVAESFLTKACQSYDQHQFDAASRYLKRGIKHTQRLSMDQKQQLSTKKLRLGDMKLLYARSLLHCGEFQDAEDALLMIIEEKVQNGFDAIRVCQALQDLALLCLHKGNANAAINHCRQAANRCLNTNSLGNGSASYFESLRLLALAMWADGNAEEAYDYAELLPNDFMLDFTDIDRIMANEMFFITKTDKPKRGRPESDDSRLNGLKTTQMASVQSNTPSPGSVNPSKEPAPTAPSTESQNSPSASSQSLLSSKVTPSISSVMQQPKDGDRHASIGSISQYTSRETIEASPRRLSESYKLRAQKILKKQGLDGDSKTDEAFFWAAKSGELLVVDLILEKRGMNASMQYTEKKTGVLNIGQSVTFTGTILHVAVKYKRYDVCKRLLEASFPVDVLDTVDNTPLDCLCDSTNPTSHDMSICGLLLDHGANIEHRHYRGGITPLLLAAGRGNVTICEYLISKGAQINAQDNGGRSALYFAVSGGHLAVCSLLSGHSAELDLPDKQGYTPMMKLLIWASSKDSTYKHHSTANSICDLLVRNGADVNPVGPFGRTALLWATYYDKIHPNCRFSIVKCLIEGGADVNAADDYGHTALIYLLKNSWDTQNFETFLKLLLEKGARVDVSTRDGKTPYNLLPRFDLDKSKISRLLKSYEEKNKRLARDAERTLSTPSTSTT